MSGRPEMGKGILQKIRAVPPVSGRSRTAVRREPAKRIYPFFIAQAGCPHRCAYCRQEASVGSGAAPSPEEVSRSLAGMLPEKGEGEIAFYGGSFTLLPPQRQRAYLEAAAPHIRARRAEGIRISTRPDALDGSTIDLLRSCGVTTVEIGCQSFSASVLRRSSRGHGPEEAAEAVARLRRAKMRIGLQLMPGLPGGDREEAIASLRTALSLRPDFLRIYPAVVLRGTALEALRASGAYSPLSLEEAVDLCADLLCECRRAGVPVIRLGLQGSPGLDSGESVAAGPYHPAFGQLVRSRLWRRALLRVWESTGTREVSVHPGDLSDALGHRRENRHFLHRRLGEFSLAPDRDLPRESLQCEEGRFALWELCERGVDQ